MSIRTRITNTSLKLQAWNTSTAPPTNQPPSVTINGASTGTVDTQQMFQAVPVDSDGTIAKVELLLMANASTTTTFTVLDTDLFAPWMLRWTPTAAGNFNLRMRATDNQGATSLSSVLNVAVTAASTGNPNPTPLAAPANLRQVSSTSSSNVLAWDTVANATGYRLRQSGIIIYTGPATTYADMGLSAAFGYTYDVQALGAGSYSNSAYSDAITATTAATPTEAFRVLAEGDSLTDRLGGEDGWVEMLRANRLSDPTFSILNFAVAGESYAQINSDAERQQLLDAMLAAGITSVILYAGINDMQGGLNGQLAYENAKAAHQFWHARGIRTAAVILHTSRINTKPLGYHEVVWTYVQEYNALLRAGFESGELGATVLLDTQSVPAWAGFDGPLNTVFFFDGLHGTIEWKKIMTKLMGRVVDALRAGIKTIVSWVSSDGGGVVPQSLALTLTPNGTYDAATKKYDWAGALDNTWQPVGRTEKFSRLNAESWLEFDPFRPESCGFSYGFNDSTEFMPEYWLLAGAIVLIDDNSTTDNKVSVYPLVVNSLLEAGQRYPVPGTRYRIWRKDKQNGSGLRVYLWELKPGGSWLDPLGEVYDFGSVGGDLVPQVKINTRSEAGLSNATTFGLS